MQPISIGIREAKVHLSKLLKKVQRGQTIILTDRGKPVGRIVPVPKENLPLTDRINELESQGWIEPRKKKKAKNILLPLPLPDNLAQKFLHEEQNP